jgi:hypothetical protein
MMRLTSFTTPGIKDLSTFLSTAPERRRLLPVSASVGTEEILSYHISQVGCLYDLVQVFA